MSAIGRFSQDLFFQMLGSHGLNFVAAYLESLKRSLMAEAGVESFMVGFELEFYLHEFGDCSISDILQEIFEQNEGSLVSVKKEVGEGQYEAVFIPTGDLYSSCASVSSFIGSVKKICQKMSALYYFQSKPFRGKPSNALQFNFSLVGEGGRSLISSDSPADQGLVLSIVSSLLGDLNDSMLFFAPTVRCYDKFLDSMNVQRVRNSPSHVCWGYGQNRTVAVRVVKNKSFGMGIGGEDVLFYNQRLEGYYTGCDDRVEVRYLSSMADPFVCTLLLMLSISDGLTVSSGGGGAVSKHAPLYGNAFEDEVAQTYQLEPIVNSLKDSCTRFETSRVRRALSDEARFLLKNIIAQPQVAA